MPRPTGIKGAPHFRPGTWIAKTRQRCCDCSIHGGPLIALAGLVIKEATPQPSQVLLASTSPGRWGTDLLGPTERAGLGVFPVDT
ncbi:hypothetical protein PHLCEN_2v6683 [Hermanssonia centrifuga]|uniref:Uncharacterized protein n=1 Tax=Hermanssonia centrifuga TaxID=98765 RepID=A0A2R6NYQ1_9APHY|nr:hypothetical protein PHLCEN_2v6683 [Hermanssonia centrifuga]